VTEAAGRKKKVKEALAILRALGFPAQQQNERSALTLLALLGLDPQAPWSTAVDPMIGITPMMDFARSVYGKDYAPNTRETFRRQTVHQFLEAGLVLANPGASSRPVNSPKAVYQIEGRALALLRTFQTPEWDTQLASYVSEAGKC
jgi:hypothetical protein